MKDQKFLDISHLVAIRDLRKDDIVSILDYAHTIKQNPSAFYGRLKGKILA